MLQTVNLFYHFPMKPNMKKKQIFKDEKSLSFKILMTVAKDVLCIRAELEYVAKLF